MGLQPLGRGLRASASVGCGRGRLAALALLATGLACWPVTTVRAHTSTIGILDVVDAEPGAVRVLRLHQGFAWHATEGWQYVCPSAYQGTGQDLAGELPEGGVALASPIGVFLMARDGTIAPHPDPEAQGVVTGFARGVERLYALRLSADQTSTDVIDLAADAVRVVWRDGRTWTDIAVGASRIQLVRFEQDSIEAVQLSFEGELLSSQRALLVDARQVTTRVVGDEGYFIAKLEASVELGRIEQDSWQILRTASNAIAGPIVTADGTGFIALDGTLTRLDAPPPAAPPAAPAGGDYVMGLSRLGDRAYAITRTGLRELAPEGLGATLFALSELGAPPTCSVPDAARSACNLEWQHMKVELTSAGIPLPTTVPTATACPAVASGAAAPEVAPTPNGGGVAGSPAPSLPATAIPNLPPSPRGGCGVVRPRDQAVGRSAAGLALACALALVQRRRGRRRY